MSFHPAALDLDTLKRLSKVMKSKSIEVLDTPLTLAQSQELLSRAMGYPNWHTAVHAQSTTSQTDEVQEDPLVHATTRYRLYTELAELTSADLGGSSGLDKFLQVFCDSANAYGRQAEAHIVKVLIAPLRQAQQRHRVKIVSDFAAKYSLQEAMAIHMMATVSWSHAFSAAASRASLAMNKEIVPAPALVNVSNHAPAR